MGNIGPSSGEQRRRSTRVDHSVALVVRGMDLLGQPFEERTATSNFNFHGCKYPSKHHLPRNTWVTLEAAQRETTEGPSCVRARVVWIQRPQTIRDFFQIAVELEAPTNVWGVDVPPEDWNRQTAEQAPSIQESEQPVWADDLTPVAEDARAAGRPTTRDPQTITEFVDELLAGARGEEGRSGGEASGVSTAPGIEEFERQKASLEEFRAQLEEKTARAINNATAKARKEVERSAETSVQERMGSAEELLNTLKAELGGSVDNAQEAIRNELNAALESNRERARELVSEIEQRTSALRTERDAAGRPTEQLAELRLQIEALNSAANARLQEQAGAPGPRGEEPGEIEWRKRVSSEMEQARTQWNELLESSIDSAVQRMTERLSESSQDALAGKERQFESRLSDLSDSALRSMGEVRESIQQMRTSLDDAAAGARASLDEIEQASSRAREDSKQFETTTKDALHQLNARLDRALTTQTAELNRRGETLVASLSSRVAPLLEVAGQQAVSEAESKLTRHFERVSEIMRELSTRELQAEESLRLHRERLRQSSDSVRRELQTEREAAFTTLREDFAQARRESLGKWVEELNTEGSRAIQAAHEELAKSADSQVQAAGKQLGELIEERLRHAGGWLDTKTEEASQRAVAALEAERAVHAENLRSQVEGMAGEVVENSRRRLEEAAQAAAASFGQVIGGVSEETLERFKESSRATIAERSADIERSASQVHGDFEARAAASLEQFRKQVSTDLKHNLDEIAQNFRSECGSIVQTLRVEGEDLHKGMHNSFEQMSSEMMGRHGDRLEQASDSWRMEAVRRLNEEGDEVVARLARTGQKAVRASFSKVFDDLAQALRESPRSEMETPPGGHIPQPEASGTEAVHN